MGFKVAGIKLKFPIYVIEKGNSAASDPSLAVDNEVSSFLTVCGVFIAGSYIMQKVSEWMERKKMQWWKSNTLLTLVKKHEDTLLLIKEKSDHN